MDELLEKMLMRPAEKLRNEKKLQKKIQNVDACATSFSMTGRDRESPKDRDRGSILARWQADFVRKEILRVTGVDAEIVIIKTSGDKLTHASFAEIGGQGVFIKELEEALLNEEIDLAVHSVKDVPTDVPSRLCFPVICRRGDVRDCLLPQNLVKL